MKDLPFNLLPLVKRDFNYSYMRLRASSIIFKDLFRYDFKSKTIPEQINPCEALQSHSCVDHTDF